MVNATPQIYTTSEMHAELRQSEIISGLIQYTVDQERGITRAEEKAYSILLSQDCDLLRDYEARARTEIPALNGALLYEMEPGERGTKQFTGSLWKPVQKNNNERYHFLQSVPEGQDLLGLGMPEFVLDFRRYSTVAPREIERQCRLPNGAKRRCRLEMPYREHLQNRAASYFQRVALPAQHESAP
jgi:hypothetical protein